MSLISNNRPSSSSSSSSSFRRRRHLLFFACAAMKNVCWQRRLLLKVALRGARRARLIVFSPAASASTTAARSEEGVGVKHSGVMIAAAGCAARYCEVSKTRAQISFARRATRQRRQRNAQRVCRFQVRTSVLRCLVLLRCLALSCARERHSPLLLGQLRRAGFSCHAVDGAARRRAQRGRAAESQPRELWRRRRTSHSRIASGAPLDVVR